MTEAEPGTGRIHLRLAELMADRRVTNEALAEQIGLSPNQLSRAKNGNIKYIRLDTLAGFCRELKCQPGDLLTYVEPGD
jgi:putative transcriptional regulator